MPTIEELPDDADLIVNPAQSAHSNPTSTFGPSLLPGMADFRAQSTSEFLTSMSRMPLFSSSTTEADPDQLAAFTSLLYEGAPSEIASNFRTQGNDAFRRKRWRDALTLYTKALETPSLSPDDPIREICLINRAATNIELKNYGSVLRDCAKTIEGNPGNVKAHYRAASALVALARWSEAVEILSRGLLLNLDHTQQKSIQALLAKSREGLVAAERKRAEEEETRALQRRTGVELRLALRKRGITVRRSQDTKAPELEGAKVALVIDTIDGNSSKKILVFPVAILYPIHAQSDFVPTWREDESCNDRIGGQVLAEPPPWDAQNEYTWKDAEVFMQTATGGLVKVGKKVPLGEVLGGGKVEIVDELVTLMVVPREKRYLWIEEWKKRKVK